MSRPTPYGDRVAPGIAPGSRFTWRAFESYRIGSLADQSSAFRSDGWPKIGGLRARVNVACGNSEPMLCGRSILSMMSDPPGAISLRATLRPNYNDPPCKVLHTTGSSSCWTGGAKDRMAHTAGLDDLDRGEYRRWRRRETAVH
jgi:hypothetical protein